MKQYIGSDFFCYGPAGENPGGSETAGYSYITANGDPSSFVYYKIDGENVIYKMWVPSASGDVAGGHFQNWRCPAQHETHPPYRAKDGKA